MGRLSRAYEKATTQGSIADNLAVSVLLIIVFFASVLALLAFAVIIVETASAAPWLLGLAVGLVVFWAAHRVVRLSRD